MAAAIDGLNARDVEAVDALFDEGVEWRPARSAGGAVEGTVYRGKRGMAQYIADVDSGFDEVLFDVRRIESISPDRVFYRGRILARGKASGVQLDEPIWGLWELRDRRLFRGMGFLSEREALEAAGLSD